MQTRTVRSVRSVRSARWSGVAAVAVLWIGIGSAVLRSGFAVGGDQPLSRLHDDERAALSFDGALVVAAVLFLVFCSYVVHRDPVGAGFAPLMVAGMVGQLVTGVVPLGPLGSSDPVHVTAGLILGGTIPLFLWRYAAGQPDGPWRRQAYLLFWAQAACTVVGIGLSRIGIAALAEVVPALGFHLWVIAVTLHHPAEPVQRRR